MYTSFGGVALASSSSSQSRSGNQVSGLLGPYAMVCPHLHQACIMQSNAPCAMTSSGSSTSYADGIAHCGCLV